MTLGACWGEEKGADAKNKYVECVGECKLEKVALFSNAAHTNTHVERERDL